MTEDDAAVEAVARALYDGSFTPSHAGPWEAASNIRKYPYRECARAAIAAYRKHLEEQGVELMKPYDPVITLSGPAATHSAEGCRLMVRA